jgi:hypothetical protein
VPLDAETAIIAAMAKNKIRIIIISTLNYLAAIYE